MPNTAQPFDDIEPSCILKSSTGIPVHIVGVSHTSPYYADYAAKVCRASRPSVVCLEVCEGRLREQARRGSLAVENRHTEIVRNAVRPFLEDNGVWAIAASSRQAQQHRLSNEGAAQLEGGFYGEEVTRSAIAATAAGAGIVAADRNKNLSKHRFKACALQKLSERAESFQHENIASGILDCISAATTSNATVFGNSVHPIFHAAASPEAAAALAACGCDVENLMESLQHLMTEGSEPGAQIDSKHLEVVRTSIRKVEQMRHSRHLGAVRQAATCKAGFEAASIDHALSPALDISASLESSQVCEPGLTASTVSWIPAMNELEGSDGGKLAGSTVEPSMAGFQEVCSGVLDGWARVVNLPAWQAWGRKRAEALEEAYLQTTVHERDCILAHRIRNVAESASPGKPVVAVVGANHVRGIIAAWERAESHSFREQCANYLSAPDLQNEPPHAWKVKAIDSVAHVFEGLACVGATGVLATAARRHLSHSAALSGTAMVGGAVAWGVKSWWASHCRPAHLVENLARFNDTTQAA